ncbi:MAG TPA: family 78 glycoside hydrolase catalytic domain [Clostridiaceae bacterium]
MTNRERFMSVLNFRNPDDRLPMIEWASWWDKTLDRWYLEGLTKDIGDDETREYLGLDMVRQFWISPRTSDYPNLQEGQGAVTDLASYEKIKKYLYPRDAIEKIKDKLLRLKPLQERGEVVVWITLEGFFWHPRVLFGIENHFYSFYDEPELMHKINNDMAEYSIYIIEEFCKILQPDFMTFAEDMSYNHGPMLSYELFSEFLKPYYNKVISVLRNYNIIPFVDTDGQVEGMIPWLVEAGIEGVLPLERQSGVDVARIREKHPNFKMIGAFDKMVMSQGEDYIRKEFERLLPVMKTGGFIPSCDHQTPPGVSFENYKIYLRLLKEYCEKAVNITKKTSPVLYSSLKIIDLKCNYLINPLGVETPSPIFSWRLLSDERAKLQSASRIVVASKIELLNIEKADLWDSGKVSSDNSIDISYGGKLLKSRKCYYYKVKVWDEKGLESEWSDLSNFEMGLIGDTDWKAKWISRPNKGIDISSNVPAPLFRKTLNINKKIQSARAYISGLGYYELYINGSKIGDEVLTPGFTRYDKTVLYNVFNITDEFVNGENVIGIILGNGWYNSFTKDAWDYKQATWRSHPKVIMQTYITFEDGEEIVINTDSSWKTSSGPIIFDGLRNGEFYDARLEKTSWDTIKYDDSNWTNAIICRTPGGKLKSSQMTAIKINGTIKPIGMKEVKPNVWVYDLGQNISGWAQIQLSGPSAMEVILRYSEKIYEDGSIDRSNIDSLVFSGEFQTDKYILKGEENETWEPRFTYHGFRYVEVSGFNGELTLNNLCGRVVHTAFESMGNFECSNELINSIQRCARWSTLTNYHGIPTDCPHREKNGWTGDASLSAEQVLLNFDPMTSYTKWMMDFRDCQRESGQLPGVVPTGGWGFNWGNGPAWDSAAILIPWYMYVYGGDTNILREMYDSMKKYLEFMTSMADEDIVDFGLGDWCPPIGGADEYKCPSAVTDTAYYYVDSDILSKVAKLLAKESDAKEYKLLSENIRHAFREKFFDIKTGLITGNCQTSLACALYQGLINEDEKKVVLERLIGQIELQDGHIDCGILGTKYIMNALTELGRGDLAYEIATKRTFPGWGYWIEQGATTLWENWNGESSQNHHMYSDISAWFYKGLAGINPDANVPGFKHIILKPNTVEGLNFVKSSHISMYGEINCSWKVEENRLILNLSIPVNCYATLYLPEKYSNNIVEGNKKIGETEGVSIIYGGEGKLALNIKSGNYCITCETTMLLKKLTKMVK